MKQHRGVIVEDIVRRSGYSIKRIAERMDVSRNTVYNRFKDPNLSYEWIARLGEVVHYDFALDFPELKSVITTETDPRTMSLWKMERKYTKLLEHYNELLSLLLRMSNDYGLEYIKKEINHFLEVEK